MDACFVDVTVEFLAVAFHNVLYYASIYPQSCFETRKKYSIVVHRCVHPDVNVYLDKCLSSIEAALKTHQLRRVEFCVTDECYRPCAKFVFEFEHMADYDDTADTYLVRSEQNMRQFCLLLTTMSHNFSGFPTDSSFEIYLHTNESVEVALATTADLEDFPLVEAEGEVVEMENILPLRRFSIRNYSIDTYIELSKPWT